MAPALLALITVLLGAAAASATRRADAMVRLRTPSLPLRWPTTVPLAWRLSRRSDAPLLSFLDGIERSLRSGASLAQALSEAAVTDEHRALAAQAERHGVVPALDRWSRRAPARSAQSLAASALVLAASTGTAGARTVEGVSATVRQRLALRDEIRALSSQARASAVLIALAPVGFLLVSVALDRGVVAFFRSPLGVAVLLAGLALDAAGAAWMARITSSVEA